MSDYIQRVRENFYKQVKNTNWGNPEEIVHLKSRGRKAKPRTIVEPTMKQTTNNKFFNFKNVNYK
jgi:hypothetical protein